MNDYPSPRSAWYAVAILTLAYIFAYADRVLLNLLVVPIRRDLGISDTQMSLLMGVGFVAFYSVFGVLLGRLADTHSRRALIAAGMVVWSLMTAGLGLARHFWHFLLLRMGVGVGEGALNPAAYSMIADYFPPHTRASALGVYGMGIYLGAGFAFIGGGVVVGWAETVDRLVLPFVGAVRPWQAVFFIVGLTGAAAALLLGTVREPVRVGKGATPPPLRQVWAYIGENRRTFFHHNLGFALLALSGYGGAAWVPTFLIRRFGWSGAQPGLVQGVIVAVFGTLGVVFGGRLADRMLRRGRPDAALRVALIAAVCWLPFGILYPLMPTGWLAATFLAPAVFFLAWPFGVAPAAIQQMMPNEMRGQASALSLLVVNVIGLGVGPTAIAVMTDYVFRDDRAVHLSMVTVTVTATLGAAVLLWTGLAPFRRSLERLEAWTATAR